MKKIYSSTLADYVAQEKDSDFVQQLDSTLQAYAVKLFKKYNYTTLAKITVQVFPEINVTKCACGDDTLNNMYGPLGCTRFTIIKLASNLAKKINYAHVAPPFSVLDEYTHALTFNQAGEKPTCKQTTWLHAALVQQNQHVPAYKYAEPSVYMQESISVHSIPRVKLLCEKYETVSQASTWAGWFSEFIIEKYGWGAMFGLIQHNGNFRKTIHRSYKQLDKEWKLFMQKRFPPMEKHLPGLPVNH